MLPITVKSIFRKCPLNSKIIINGWVRSLRKQKNIAFGELNDGSSPNNLQIVMKPSLADAIIAGTSIEVEGMLVKSHGHEQQFELLADSVKILGSCTSEKKEHGLEFIRKYAHLRGRTLFFSSVNRIRSGAATLLRNYLIKNDFIELHAPVITFSDCEGGGENFHISEGPDFFGSDASLTVSSQLHGEIGACTLGRVFTFGPIFRAEKHHTKRHLSEFWMLEPEIAFMNDINSLAELIEDHLKCVTKELIESFKDDVDLCLKHSETPQLTEKRILDLQFKPFQKIQYKEAVELLLKSGETFKFPVKWGLALQTEHEKYLAEKIFDGPLFITDYPEMVKAFYMKFNGSQLDSNGATVACLDLIFPEIGEVVGGSIREDRLDLLESKLSKFGLNQSSLDWYLDLRRFGSVPHGGFGLGFDRYLQYITGTSNIRDVALIPRYEGSNKY